MTIFFDDFQNCFNWANFGSKSLFLSLFQLQNKTKILRIRKKWVLVKRFLPFNKTLLMTQLSTFKTCKNNRTYSIKFFFRIPHIFVVIFGHKINIWMKLVPWTRQYFSSRHHDFFCCCFNFFCVSVLFWHNFYFHLVMIFGVLGGCAGSL